jgi:hypothetical protein
MILSQSTRRNIWPQNGLAALLLIFFSLLSLPSIWASSTADQLILDKKMELFEFWQDPAMVWVWEFQSLCSRADILCGTEILPGAMDPSGYVDNRVLKNTTVSTVLERIIDSKPDYQWVIDGGVLTIVPRETFWNKVRRRWYGRPLSRKIKTLDLVDIPLDSAAHEVCRAAGYDCGPGAGTSVITSGTDQDLGKRLPFRKVTLHLSDVTVREALNALVRKDGHARWEFRYPATCLIDQWVYYKERLYWLHNQQLTNRGDR